MKQVIIVFAFIFAAVAGAAPVTYTSFPAWQTATAPGPYGIESYNGGLSGLQTSGSAVTGISSGNLHVWLRGDYTVEFSLLNGGLFSAFILDLTTAPAWAGSGLTLFADSAAVATVGTTGVFDGWVGFTSSAPVAVVSLSTQSWGNGLPWEHLDVDAVQWTTTVEREQQSSVPEPGTLGMGLIALGLLGVGRMGKATKVGE